MMLAQSCLSVDMRCGIDSNKEKFKGGSGFVCEVFQNFSVTDQNDVVTSLNGHSGWFQHQTEIRHLRFNSMVLHYLPRDIEKFLPNLQSIHIYDSHLKVITQEDLKPFTGLRRLNIQLNDIERLDGDLLKFNRELIEVNFSHNRNLKIVGKDILKTLPNLKRAFFQDSNCVDKFADNEDDLQELADKFEANCIPTTWGKVKTWFSDLF